MPWIPRTQPLFQGRSPSSGTRAVKAGEFGGLTQRGKPGHFLIMDVAGRVLVLRQSPMRVSRVIGAGNVICPVSGKWQSNMRYLNFEGN